MGGGGNELGSDLILPRSLHYVSSSDLKQLSLPINKFCLYLIKDLTVWIRPDIWRMMGWYGILD